MLRLFLLAPFVLLVGCAEPADAPAGADPSPSEAPAELAITDAYIPAAPQGGTTALFAEIVGGPETDSLVAAAFIGAGRVEVHESTEREGGMRGMREVPAVPVPAGGVLSLRPGGYHVMLIGLERDLNPGDSVDVALTFARTGTRTVRAGVRSLSDLPEQN